MYSVTIFFKINMSFSNVSVRTFCILTSCSERVNWILSCDHIWMVLSMMVVLAMVRMIFPKSFFSDTSSDGPIASITIRR